MLLGISSCLNHTSPEDWAAKHKALGLKSINFPVDYLSGEETYMAYKRAADEAGLIIAEVGIWRNTLAADPEERAKRRIKQLKEKGEKVPSLEEMISDIEKRDKQDMTREIAPLKKADDAMVLDSTSLTIDEVCKFIVDEYQNRI